MHQKTKGRFTGLLFLGTFVAGAIGTSLRGLSVKPGTNEYIANLIDNASQMKLAMGLDMISASFIVLISLFVYSQINKYNKSLAIGYVVLASINFTVIALSNMLHLQMVTLAANGELNKTLLAMSNAFHKSYYSLHFLILIVYSLNGGILYYFLLKSGVAAKWISTWGLVASAIVVVSGLLNLIEIDTPFIVYAQNGIFVLAFITYLLVAGFRNQKLA